MTHNISMDFKVKITRFYPYETVQLTDRFLELSGDNYASLKNEFQRELKMEFGETKIPYNYVGITKGYCRLAWDNKITFQIITNHGKGTTMYVQFYDNVVHFGMKLEKRNYNPDTHYLEII